MNGFNFPKGSEWRKWDLQVHTPFSYLNNQFGTDFGEYVKQLFKRALEKDIAAIGVTDYFTIEGYKKLKNEYLDKDKKLRELDFCDEEIDKIKKLLILPDIEFRLNKLVGSNRINFHVIFSDESSINDIEENFLREIKFVYEGTPQDENEERALTIQNLEDLGNKLKRDHAEFRNKTDIEIGMMNAVVDDSKFLKILSNKKSIFEGKYLMFVPADEDLSRISWDSQDHNVRKLIIQESDGFLSSNEGTREFGLGERHSSTKEFIREFKTLKPCIWSSDAKNYDQLFEPNLKRYTWIKADPTFEGLKQIIYEPEGRVYIGEEPPRKIERNKIIKSLAISNSNRWFEDKPILLNEGLVSIIGGKGTGKTAVLDLIAYATGSYKCYEKNETKSKSFLKKAFKELANTKIKIEWDEGNPDEIILSNKLEESYKEGKVRYLPQDYIDQLCSAIGESELEEQIENVIFQKISPENKASFSDFKNYKESQLKVINDKKNRITKQINETISKIYEYKTFVDLKTEKTEGIKKIEDNIKKYDKEIKKISGALKDSTGQEKILDELSSTNEQKSDVEKIISDLTKKILKIEELINEIQVFLEDSKTFTANLKDELQDLELTKEDIEEIKVVLCPENLVLIINFKKQEIEEKIKNQENKLEKINKKIDELKGKIGIEKSKQDKIDEINKLLSDLKKKKDSLDTEIKRIEDIEKKLPGILEEKEKLFINYFKLIYEEKEKLKEIYAPLKNILRESTEENKKLFDLTVKFDFHVDAMAEEGYELVDLRADGIFRQSRPETLKEKLNELGFQLNLDKNTISETTNDTIKQFIKGIENLFTKDNKTILSQLKEKRYTEQDFYNWLYSTKYYSISYSIKFNNIELNNLSPGLKGIALLILFLELDKEDKRPILIDQPEENLDNRSVYLTLMRYFREAKKRRQMIVVTHNPNLVVNTDSEQVIVANFDRGMEKQSSRISYVCGSLENTFKDASESSILKNQGIREHVCEILEGGKEAFEKRERKYGF